jgi:hypothetical protein
MRYWALINKRQANGFREYQKLKQRRRSLEDKFKQGDRSQELIKELESISKTLEDDPPTVETLYGADRAVSRNC